MMNGKILLPQIELLLGVLFAILCTYRQIEQDTSPRRDGSNYFKVVVIDGNTAESTTSSDTLRTSEESLYCKMVEEGVIMPHIVLSQSLLETGFFTSKIYKFNRNPFGMKVSSRNNHIVPGTAEHTKLCYDKIHACYRNIDDAIKDFKEWQQLRLSAYTAYNERGISTNSDYYRFLNNLRIGKGTYRYAEDKKYTEKVNRIYNKWGKSHFFATCAPESLGTDTSRVIAQNHGISSEPLREYITDTLYRYPQGENLIIISY